MNNFENIDIAQHKVEISNKLEKIKYAYSVAAGHLQNTTRRCFVELFSCIYEDISAVAQKIFENAKHTGISRKEMIQLIDDGIKEFYSTYDDHIKPGVGGILPGYDTLEKETVEFWLQVETLLQRVKKRLDGEYKRFSKEKLKERIKILRWALPIAVAILAIISYHEILINIWEATMMALKAVLEKFSSWARN